jgi:hypothetical protein
MHISLPRIVAALALATFALVGAFGLLIPADMAMGGTSPGCVALGHGGSMCPMSAADHLASWQGGFRSLSPRAFRVEVAAFLPLFFVAALRLALASAPARRLAYGSYRPPPNLVARLISEGIMQRTVYG